MKDKNYARKGSTSESQLHRERVREPWVTTLLNQASSISNHLRGLSIYYQNCPRKK